MKEQFFSFGFQGGFIQTDADFTTLSTQNQWVPGVGHDPSLGNGETFFGEKVTAPELNAGIMWYTFMKKRSMLYVGLSAAHLTEPSVSYFETSDSKLNRKYIANVGSYLEMNKKFAIIPASSLQFFPGAGIVVRK